MRRQLVDKNIYVNVLIQFSTLVLHKSMHEKLRGKTKFEFERLKLVGDAAINFCVVFDIFLNMKPTVDIKEMNIEKVNRIKTESIQKAFEKSSY